MRLTVLGSAAAEGIPALWCECDVCGRAMREGGRELRRRTAYRLDADTLIDFGPDAFWQSVAFHTDLTRVKRIVFTHSHQDHLNPVDLLWRHAGYSVVTHPVKVCANQAVINRIHRNFIESFQDCDFQQLQLEFLKLEPGRAVVDDDLEIIPIRANHAPGEVALNLILRRGGAAILIANDTGIWADEEFDKIKNIRLDAAIIECTCAFRHPESRKGHLGVNGTLRMRERLMQAGCLTAATPVWANHFSHNGDAGHGQLEAFFAPHGVGVAYDGLTVEV